MLFLYRVFRAAAAATSSGVGMPESPASAWRAGKSAFQSAPKKAANARRPAMLLPHGLHGCAAPTILSSAVTMRLQRREALSIRSSSAVHA
jgi:hypothetical protein